MENMNNLENMTVVITQYRYEELLDCVTRRNVLVDMLANDNHMDAEQIFRILGQHQHADEIRSKREKEYAKMMEHREKGGDKNA